MLQRYIAGSHWQLPSPSIYIWEFDNRVVIESLGPHKARLSIGLRYYRHFPSMWEAAKWFVTHVQNFQTDRMVSQMFHYHPIDSELYRIG